MTVVAGIFGLEYSTVLFPCRCPALLVVGDTSPAVEAVVSFTPASRRHKKLWEMFAAQLSINVLLMLPQVECNSRLNPTKTTLLKVKMTYLMTFHVCF